MYWQTGRDFPARQAEQGRGAKVIDRLAHDLRAAFPDMKGFSPRNFEYMRTFATAWLDTEIVQQAAAQLPWDGGTSSAATAMRWTIGVCTTTLAPPRCCCHGENAHEHDHETQRHFQGEKS